MISAPERSGRVVRLRSCDEPTAADGIAAGADLVLFSGDKLLGGPQCGIMIGKEEAIGRIESDPLDARSSARQDDAGRARGDTSAGTATSTEPSSEFPLWKMIATPLATLATRAEKLAAAFRDELGLNAAVLPSESFIGGGSTPDQSIATMAVAVSPPFPSHHDSATGWATALRQGNPVGRDSRPQRLCYLRLANRGRGPGTRPARRGSQGLS